MIEIIQATQAHVQSIQLRQTDVEEIMATSGREPAEALAACVAASTESWCGLVDGKPIALFGVGPLNILNGMGSPWMVGSDLLNEHAFELLRKSRPWVEQMHRLYPVLFNLVDERNVISRRWLRWLGFSFYKPIRYGVEGRMFIPFERIRRV